MIQEFLDLRKRYLYREEVVPWIVARTNSIASEKKSDPFHFEPVEASTHCFRIEDDVLVLIGEKKRGEKKEKERKVLPIFLSWSAFKKKHLSSASSKTTPSAFGSHPKRFCNFCQTPFLKDRSAFTHLKALFAAPKALPNEPKPNGA
ncbi:unnamed protein product [Prunus brigantina]